MWRAAGPQCQHVRGMPWSYCLTGGTSVSGHGPGGMVSLDSASSLFVAVWCEQQDGGWCRAFS